jgi:general secretion pathway protein K
VSGASRLGLRSGRRAGLKRERGVALLTAILLVALGTMIATAIAYRTAMTARRGQGNFAFDQSILIAQAGEAIASYALRESRSNYPQNDAPGPSPGQPWATHYGPLAVTDGVTLEAWLEDMQGRFNLNNLVDASGVQDPKEIQTFQSLLQILGLEPDWAERIADWIDADSIVEQAQGAEDSTYLSQLPPYRTANRQITSASELLALQGFGPDRYAQIEPYVTALPRGTKINLCTAKPQVLDALNPTGERNWSTMDPMSLAQQRQQNPCFPTVQEFQQAFSTDAAARGSPGMTMVGTQSDYFRLTSVVSIGSAQFYLYSLLHREQNGNKTRVIQRSFTAD